MLNNWSRTGGNLSEKLLFEAGVSEVSTPAEAEAVCNALAAYRANPSLGKEDLVESALGSLTRLLRIVQHPEAIGIVKRNGLPHLRALARDYLQGGARDAVADEQELLLVLWTLAAIAEPEDVSLIVEVVRTPVAEDDYYWTFVFEEFYSGHPHSLHFVDALRDPLPGGFMRVAYLDLVNYLSINDELERHPFDTKEGRQHLADWLSNTDPAEYSYARSATAALPFIGQGPRTNLLQLALDHEDSLIRLEGAWVLAVTGDAEGLTKLAEACRNPAYSTTAQQYLKELNKADMIPAPVRTADFKALVEMADWLSYPTEYGRPPDNVEIYDKRTLYWPPTGDVRPLWLLKYTYLDGEGGEADVGVGIVGSSTFALFDEASANLSPEDIYGLYCSRELESDDGPQTPEAGRALLRRRNAGF